MRRHSRRFPHWALLLACVVCGCRKGDIVPGVSDSAFVATMAELRRIDAPPSDSAASAARRRVLQQRGLTGDQLERAGRALAADPDRATALFEAIQRRMLATPDTVPAKR
ncbi:MAG: hypothetical protein HOQ11_12365 [Gemmatimonadaceae bacterium]|nr:hypothetical protein [Gemmatimonadaceae bacterium]NUQ92663.1 hypothetical protein [Gemmatimonadaceae bacterium]NUR18121.1 hypothetical protein [Gemmatimonadaceae bacterium]NUS98189.1 hypothetical protein [Gemmatimonadaceae bacterium]